MRGVSPVPASAAGFVVLWPMVPRPAAQFWPDKFREQGATSLESKEKAQLVVLLDYAVWGNDEVGNWRLGFLKVLCGLSEDEEVVIDQPTDEQKAKVNAWLDPIISQLGHRGSREDFQALFLQRQGELVTDADGPARVSVATHPGDGVFLRDLPWPLEQIQYPWLKVPIAINRPRPS
ncbi:contractile injection system tape measure protein [Streptomyces sp. NPDC007856]|uniref:contractile injection system tape measure protein n=1 Tax=Streptomyces sp. NPDC007856 TaxID=3364781 RepID=UPI00369CBE36